MTSGAGEEGDSHIECGGSADRSERYEDVPS